MIGDGCSTEAQFVVVGGRIVSGWVNRCNKNEGTASCQWYPRWALDEMRANGIQKVDGYCSDADLALLPASRISLIDEISERVALALGADWFRIDFFLLTERVFINEITYPSHMFGANGSEGLRPSDTFASVPGPYTPEGRLEAAYRSRALRRVDAAMFLGPLLRMIGVKWKRFQASDFDLLGHWTEKHYDRSPWGAFLIMTGNYESKLAWFRQRRARKSCSAASEPRARQYNCPCAGWRRALQFVEKGWAARVRAERPGAAAMDIARPAQKVQRYKMANESTAGTTRAAVRPH